MVVSISVPCLHPLSASSVHISSLTPGGGIKFCLLPSSHLHHISYIWSSPLMAASTSDFLSSITLEDFSASLPSPHLAQA